jgi:hypothetical protein
LVGTLFLWIMKKSILKILISILFSLLVGLIVGDSIKIEKYYTYSKYKQSQLVKNPMVWSHSTQRMVPAPPGTIEYKGVENSVKAEISKEEYDYLSKQGKAFKNEYFNVVKALMFGGLSLCILLTTLFFPYLMSKEK